MPVKSRIELPVAGFVREKTVLAHVPVDRSTLWRWVKTGHFPQPVQIGPNTTAWRAEDVRRFLADPLQPITF